MGRGAPRLSPLLLLPCLPPLSLSHRLVAAGQGDDGQGVALEADLLAGGEDLR